MTSGQVLAERDADAPADPASLTKLMTAYLRVPTLKEKKLTLSRCCRCPNARRAERKGGGSLIHRAAQQADGRRPVARHDRQPGNDASVALAEGVGGTLTTSSC